MQKEEKHRLFMLLVIFGVLAFLLVARLFYLQIIKYRFFAEKSLEQRTGIITMAAPRGDIFDCNGEVLATSINTYSIFAVPKEIADRTKTAAALSPLLKMSAPEILNILGRHPTFVWLSRKQDKAVADKIENLQLKGVYALVEKKRVYPKGNMAASIIGFVGMDNEGLAGIELSCDEFLRGKEGRVLTERDPSGYQIISASKKILESPLEGMNITLTIDETIQYYTEKALAKSMEKYKGKQGLAIVMDPKTGYILAAASSPGFDPNHYSQFPKERWQSKIASFVYEPGSTFKVITTASALDAGAINLKTELKALDQIEVGGRIIENSHQVHWPGSHISVSKMLEESINTGVVQVGLKLGKERLYRYIRQFGFGDLVDLKLPGASKGIVNPPEYWYKPDIAMITFGQSIAITPIQLLAAMAAIANDGKRVKPILVKKIESLDGRYLKVFDTEEVARPISAQTAAEVKQLMENVVLKGSGRYARIKGFHVGGKTGTAQKIVEGGRGYLKGHYIASFVGMAPLSNPRLVALVLVDDPRGSYWGETVAAPFFKMILESSLRYYNIPPDSSEAYTL